MTQPLPNELAMEIVAVYRGPLEEFVTRRDALAKQLRAAKQREAADRVKALRKPSRIAWVLDSIVHEDPSTIEQLDAAIKQAQTGADLRAALETVKAAVRNAAAVGARVAVRAGQPLEPHAVGTALQAVIGDATAFAELRAGLLVEVPEGGGLDMLIATVGERPVSTRTHSPAPRVPDVPKNDAQVSAAKQDAELAKAARAELRSAEALFAKVSERSTRATHSVANAQKRLDAAERALLQAQADVEARRAELARARDDAVAATASLQDAEQVAAAARARVADLQLA